MKTIVVITAAMFFGAMLAQSLGAEKPSAEHARLLGKWKAEWVEANGERNEPQGDAATQLEFKPAEIALASQTVKYTLDTETDPKLIDVISTAADTGKETTLEGIYKIEEGKLTVCVYFSNDGVSKRPDAFETSEGSKRIMIQFVRIP